LLERARRITCSVISYARGRRRSGIGHARPGCTPWVEAQFAPAAGRWLAVHDQCAATFGRAQRVQAQHQQHVRPANYRVRQLFDRMAPHLAVGRRYLSVLRGGRGAHPLVATLRPWRTRRIPFFARTMRLSDDFEWVPTGEPQPHPTPATSSSWPATQCSSAPCRNLYRHYTSGVFDRALAARAGRLGELPRGVYPAQRAAARPAATHLTCLAAPAKPVLRPSASPGHEQQCAPRRTVIEHNSSRAAVCA